MKRILYILFSLLWLTSCSDEGMQSSLDPETGDKVTYTIGMNIPEMQQADSRVLGEWEMNDAQNIPLQLVVFDANSFFVEAVDAIFKEVNGEEVFFDVTLSATEEKRIIHFILNSPKASTAYTFGMEHELIGQLATGNQTAAYWQRLELPNGTAVYGTDQNGYVTVSASEDAQTRMEEIPMIRNFAKVTVESKDANFFLEEFTIVNAWDQGTVAPYNQTGGTGGFATFHTEEHTGRTYEAITEDGYEGTLPIGASISGIEDFISCDEAFYMYERRNTYDNTNPTPVSFMLVKGKYGGKDYYYKIDLIYNSGGQIQYYNILRNFHYHVIINGVSGLGYDTAEDAASKPASNNLNSSVDIRDFTNIAATADERLFVSYTDLTVVEAGTVEVKYRYMNGQDNYENDVVTIEELTEGDSKDCLVSAIKVGENDSEGWQTVQVTFDRLPTNEEVYTNTLRFVVYNESGVPHLAREVDFNLRKPMNMVVECNPRRGVEAKVDAEVTANILIPTGITESHDPYQLFPLEFLVEAEKLSLYPDVAKNDANITLSPSEMPVHTGASIIPEVDENTFRYVRTVTIEEYNALSTQTVMVNGVTGTYKVIPCYFKTNKANNATSVYAYNKYFTLRKEGYFLNGTGIISNASLTETSYYYGGKNVSVKFTANEDGVYTITSANLNGSATVRLSGGEIYTSPEGTFTTATWADAGKVRVTFEDGDYVEINGTGARDVLQMWARSATYGGNPLEGTTSLGMYDTQEAAKAMSVTPLKTMTVEALTGGYTDWQKAGLLANEDLYFSFVEGDYIYVASTIAEALAARTADLDFVRYNLPTQMSVSLGDGTQYYGIGRTFTLTFKTNKPGTYSISSNVEGSVSNDILSYSDPSTGMTLNGDNTFTVSAAGEYTLKCTTRTWSTKAAVYITCLSDDAKASAVGADRNKLLVSKETAVSGTNNDIRTLSVTYAENLGKPGEITTNQKGNWFNRSYYIQGEITLADIPSAETELTFSYTYWGRTYSAKVKAGDLIAGTATIDLK